MIRRFVPLASLVGFMALGLAQNPVTRPQAGAAAQPEDVIRINVNLVQVDALVTDAQGHLVDNLTKADFEIRQDGKPQVITNFSYISTKPSQPAAAAAAPPARGKKPAINPAAPPPVPVHANQARRTFAFVVDDLALAAENVPAVRAALERFVDQEMQPGDLAAVIRTGSGMGSLEQFTTDKRVLHLAIDRIRYNAMGRVGISSFGGGGGGGGMGGQLMAERRSNLNAASISAITTVVNGLRELPGRKTVILFTEDLHIMAGGVPDPRAQTELNRLTDAAGRAGVVISSIDPRGLQTFALTAADHPRNAARASAIPAQRSMRMFASQDGMVLLAQATGGTFTHDNNDLPAAVHRVVEDSNGYYLIGYHPAASTFDPKTGQFHFHRIAVRVKRPGYQVRTRTGFLGNADAPQRVRVLTPQAELVHALMSPFGSGNLHVRMTALFAHNAKTGSWINALLFIDARDLKFEDQPDGTHKAVVEAVSATITENQKVEDPSARTFTITLKEDRYQQALRSGFTYTLRHPVKKPGGYQMRIAVRDSNSLQIGSASQFIEVPDVAKGRLALSSITLRDATGALPPSGNDAPEGPALPENPLGTVADRSFVPGEPVLFALQILNARTDASKHPQLDMEARIFRDGVQINASAPHSADTASQGDPAHLVAAGELRLGPAIQPGDYVLQVIVTDKLADEQYRVASQWMDFEVRAPQPPAAPQTVPGG
jgi:VWFA-related protein